MQDQDDKCERCGGKRTIPFPIGTDDVIGSCPDCATAPQPTEREKSLAMNIVNQILNVAETPVEKRQSINDQCDKFVCGILAAQRREHEADIQRRREAIEKCNNDPYIEYARAIKDALYVFDDPNRNYFDRP